MNKKDKNKYLKFGVLVILLALALNFSGLMPFSIIGNNFDIMASKNSYIETINFDNEFLDGSNVWAGFQKIDWYFHDPTPDRSFCSQFIQSVDQSIYGTRTGSFCGGGCAFVRGGTYDTQGFDLDPDYTQPDRREFRLAAYQENLLPKILDNKKITFTYNGSWNNTWESRAYDIYSEDTVISQKEVKFILGKGNNGIVNDAFDVLVSIGEYSHMDLVNNIPTPRQTASFSGVVEVSKEGIFVDGVKKYNFGITIINDSERYYLTNVETGEEIFIEELYALHYARANRPSNCGESLATKLRVTSNLSITESNLGPVSVCGNNVCESGENETNCFADCGSVEPPVEPSNLLETIGKFVVDNLILIIIVIGLIMGGVFIAKKKKFF